VRARLLNTHPRAVVAPGASRARALRPVLALAVAGACAVAIAACAGGGSQGAQALLGETFSSHAPIRSGRMFLSFALTPAGAAGSPAARGPLSLSLQGPFQSAGAGQLPHFELQAQMTAVGDAGTAGRTLHLGATSTGGQLFIELGGTPFLAPAATVQALRQGYLQATRAGTSAEGSSPVAALGIDPGEWLEHPSIVGHAELDGNEAVHVVAGLNARRFFADAARLTQAGSPLGSGGLGSELLAPGDLAALESSLRSARVDVYTGSADHLLRALSVRATFSPPDGARGTPGGLRAATLTLLLRFAQLNEPQTILAPSKPQPISRLLPALERLGLLTLPQPSG
jgi:hypothetical protein